MLRFKYRVSNRSRAVLNSEICDPVGWFKRTRFEAQDISGLISLFLNSLNLQVYVKAHLVSHTSTMHYSYWKEELPRRSSEPSAYHEFYELLHGCINELAFDNNTNILLPKRRQFMEILVKMLFCDARPIGSESSFREKQNIQSRFRQPVFQFRVVSGLLRGERVVSAAQILGAS
jgi:hypothetical protein